MTTEATRLSRRTLLAGLTAGLAAPVLTGPALAEPLTRSLRPPPRGGVPAAAKTVARPAEAAALIAAAKLGGQTGCIVLDAATGQVLEAMNPDVRLPPASVAKTITSLYGLERLGASWRFGTRILATGPVAGGKVQGDLILSGGGDPTLTTDQLGDLAQALKARGIRGVTGRFIAGTGTLPTLDRLSADQPDHVGYNPALSRLNLNFNRVYFEWKRAGGNWRLTMDARAERFVPQVSMASIRIVNRERPLFTYEGGRDSDKWTVAAAALGKGGSRWLPVRHPGLYAGEVFRTLAAAQGITLPPATVATSLPAGASELASTGSDPLQSVLREMLKHSTNLTAECVGLSASGGGSLEGSGRMMTEWARTRYGMTSEFHDHSGLGSASRTTPSDMARTILAADRAGTGLRGILRDVGMRDPAGKMAKGSPVRVLAKTGTLNFCSGLAGLIVPPSGREMVFAIFSADVPRREAIPRAEREQPAGGPAWVGRARTMQGKLIARWHGLYA